MVVLFAMGVIYNKVCQQGLNEIGIFTEFVSFIRTAIESFDAKTHDEVNSHRSIIQNIHHVLHV